MDKYPPYTEKDEKTRVWRNGFLSGLAIGLGVMASLAWMSIVPLIVAICFMMFAVFLTNI